MQKAIIIQSSWTDTTSQELSARELNMYLSEGWRVICASPCGMAISQVNDEGIYGQTGCGFAAMLVIIEHPSK